MKKNLTLVATLLTIVALPQQLAHAVSTPHADHDEVHSESKTAGEETADGSHATAAGKVDVAEAADARQNRTESAVGANSEGQKGGLFGTRYDKVNILATPSTSRRTFSTKNPTSTASVKALTSGQAVVFFTHSGMKARAYLKSDADNKNQLVINLTSSKKGISLSRSQISTVRTKLNSLVSKQAMEATSVGSSIIRVSSIQNTAPGQVKVTISFGRKHSKTITVNPSQNYNVASILSAVAAS